MSRLYLVAVSSIHGVIRLREVEPQCDKLGIVEGFDEALRTTWRIGIAGIAF